MREIAERVLLADTLGEKLRPGPVVVADSQRGPAIALPDGPGRPPELRVRADGVRADFPGVNRLDDAHERGVMLHFLANHELLAAELMALVLLRFPDAPAEYRAGVYQAMREEQAHAMMYLRRMRECGIHFGELPVNDHFWRIVAPMATPLDFVTRLNLTFEQANLDFSRHYAGLFREAGDTATAAVLEKIHLDEIGHVGHGLKWFRRWKERGQSDWDAYRRCLGFPLTPVRAKGLAPFNADSRRLAGLDEDFIRRLEVCEFSRGRTPVLHWFNPNAEGWARAARAGRSWTPDRTVLAFERDLEALMMGVCRRDDALLMRRPPSVAHLQTLKAAGFDAPEIITMPAQPGRRLGGLRPWAWSPDAATALQPLAEDVGPTMEWQWHPGWPLEWFSKEIGLKLEAMLARVAPELVGAGALSFMESGSWGETQEMHELPDGDKDAPGRRADSVCLLRDEADVLREIERRLPLGQVLLKAPFACAGRGHLRVAGVGDGERRKTRGWIRNTLAGHGAVVVEPWLERVLDFSALYEIRADGGVRRIGMTRMDNDDAGRFAAIRVSRKWGQLMEPEVAAFLFREARVAEIYRDAMPVALKELLPGHTGPLGVDAMVHRRGDGTLALRPVVELNVRMTMGRLAWEWLRRSPDKDAGTLRVLRKDAVDEQTMRTLRDRGVFINDIDAAEMFLAHWSTAAG